MEGGISLHEEWSRVDQFTPTPKGRCYHGLWEELEQLDVTTEHWKDSWETGASHNTSAQKQELTTALSQNNNQWSYNSGKQPIIGLKYAPDVNPFGISPF